MKIRALVLTLIIFTINLTATELPWQDDFSDGDFVGWTIVDDQPNTSGPGSWQVEDRVLTQTSNIYVTQNEYEVFLGTHIYTGDANWQNYSFNANIKSTDDDGIGILFRYQDYNNYYRLILLQDAGNRGPFQRLQKRVNGSFTTIAEDTPDQAIPSGWFSITADVRGDTITIYLNHELLFQTIDQTFNTGKIGFMCYAHNGTFIDDVSVTSEKLVYEKPEQHTVQVDRLPYIQNPQQHSVQIAWRTKLKKNGQVEFGETLEYGNTVVEDSSTNKHLVTLSQLKQNTTYYYRVLNDGVVLTQGDSFRTAKSESIDSVSFLIWGDSGTGWQIQYDIAEIMQQHKVDFCLHVGDVSQSNGSEYDNIFFKPYTNIVKSRCIFTCIGNHDTNADYAQTYLDDFYLPHNNPDSTERYYSFNWGNVHCIALDTNIDYSPNSPQYQWLVDDLNSEMRAKTTWTIMYFHHPPYCQGWDTWAGDVNVQNYLLPVFEQYNVDLVFNGHTHDYERGLLNGIYYIITGGGGATLDTWGRSYDHIDITLFKDHFTRVDIQGNELHLQAIDKFEKVIDSITIKKSDTAVDKNNLKIPTELKLGQNYPNPFNPSTSIEFELQKASFVKLQVYNLKGQLVDVLVNANKGAGIHKVTFNADHLPAGLYYYKLTAQNQTLVKKMLLIK